MNPMMMNYFSPMDASASYFHINWLSSMAPLLAIIMLHKIPSLYYITISALLKILKKLIIPIINFIKTPSFNMLFFSIFILLSLQNYTGLFPFNFTNTSHMNLNFSLALTMWLTFIIFAWFNNTNFMMAHLIPESTPFPLIPFMILIEIISQIIRPLTLAIRLTTNMIAGHLMMTLLTSMMAFLTFSSLTTTLMMLVPLMVLMILESAMALIQAYIFMILLTLYAKEMNYSKIFSHS